MNLSYTNIPSWISQNWIFRKLFLLRKLYFSQTKFGHHSQFAEDISIGRLFPKTFKGFFVDVGCFHPKKYNNTWSLYKRGWRGINIDIDAIKVEGFDIVRPEDTNINRAVSNTEDEVTYYTNGFYSLTTTLDRDFVGESKGYIEKKTKAAKLTCLIDSTKYKDTIIDFLSIDAEAHDFEVLKSLDFERYAPRLIAIETHKYLFPEVEQEPMYKFLIDQGYCLAAWCGHTILLANESLQQRLSSS